MVKKIIGGRLCLFNNVENDIYTKGDRLIPSMPSLWIDQNNENVVIKICSIQDCEISKKMAELFDFVPRYYGCYPCEDVVKTPKYKKPGEFNEVIKKIRI